MRVSRLLPLFLLPLLAACSDQRATFEIKGSAHALSLIRVTSLPWDKVAKYSLVAARMPDCMRRHPMAEAGLDVKTEIYAAGNDAWIIRQNERLFVTETRTCEGFAKLDKAPEGGLGVLAGVFEMRNDVLVFTAAPKPPPPAVVAEPEASAAIPEAVPASEVAPAKN